MFKTVRMESDTLKSTAGVTTMGFYSDNPVLDYPIITLDAAASLWQDTEEVLTGVWSATPTWTTYDDNTQFFRMDDEAATLDMKDGNGDGDATKDATIVSHDAGRWS